MISLTKLTLIKNKLPKISKFISCQIINLSYHKISNKGFPRNFLWMAYPREGNVSHYSFYTLNFREVMLVLWIYIFQLIPSGGAGTLFKMVFASSTHIRFICVIIQYLLYNMIFQIWTLDLTQHLFAWRIIFKKLNDNLLDFWNQTWHMAEEWKILKLIETRSRVG